MTQDENVHPRPRKKTKKKEEKEVLDQRSDENKRKKNSQSKIGRKQKKKIPNQRLEENKGKKRERFLIKDRKRTKENIQKGLQTRQYLNNTDKKKLIKIIRKNVFDLIK